MHAPMVKRMNFANVKVPRVPMAKRINFTNNLENSPFLEDCKDNKIGVSFCWFSLHLFDALALWAFILFQRDCSMT